MAIEQDNILTYLQQIDEYEFEHFIAELLGQYDWNTQVTADSNDRGIDIIADKEKPFHQKTLIQVKRWGEDNKVGGPDIREYSSLRQGQGDVDAVVVMITSSFSSQAEKEANDLNVKLVDGADLCRIIAEAGAERLVREYTDCRCHYCGDTFEGDLQLRHHLCEEHGYIECSHCEDVIQDDPALREHLCKDHGHKRCPYCKDTFQDDPALREHLCKEHGHERCPYCKDTFQDDPALREHLCKEHGHERCTYCKDTFQNDPAIREHLCKEHGHSECSYCGVLFRDEQSIREHLSEDHEHSELSRIDRKRVNLYDESPDSGQ